jgi:hypothetical protein
MRSMLKEAGLPMEFWDDTVNDDAYIRKCTNIGPHSNGRNRSITEPFTDKLLDIQMCKTWESKSYSYINPMIIPNG